MVEFLRTNAISSKIDDITIEAKEGILLVCPYLNIPKILYERLKEKTDEGVFVTLIYGKKNLDNKQEQLLKKIKNITIYFLENLHAKCYLNEQSAILTSMNLYDFSQKNNREMGIFCNKKTSPDLYNELHLEVNSIIKAATLIFRSENFEAATKQSNFSFNQRLYSEIKKNYPDFLFTYEKKNDMIECTNFGKYFRLQIEPKYSYYRINFTIAYRSDRNRIYDILHSKSSLIEKKFPRGVVNWGNQMGRIKLDFPLNYSPFSTLPNSATQDYLTWVNTAKDLFENILDACYK